MRSKISWRLPIDIASAVLKYGSAWDRVLQILSLRIQREKRAYLSD